MLITVQFPFADLRPFVAGPTYRLLTPDWPTPRGGIDFIRLLGQVRDRWMGGVAEWSGEHMFCDAARALRFEPTFSLEKVTGERRRHGAYRRFFSDGEGLSRIEVGVAFRGLQPWFLQDFLAALHDAASLPVSIGRGAGLLKTQLLKSAAPLARLTLQATTSRKADESFKPSGWWVTSCDSMLLIEYNITQERLPLPPGFRQITHDKIENTDLAYGRMSFLKQSVGVWLFGTVEGADLDYHRRLRIHLMRLHAQREVIKEVLRAIHVGRVAIEKTSPGDPEGHPSNRLQKFLRDTIQRMERREYGGLPQSALLKGVEEIQDSVTEGERTAILEQIQPLRKVVFSAVERFTELKDSTKTIVVVEPGGTYQMTNNTQNVNVNAPVHGDVQVNQLVAETITNALNRVQQSEAPEAMKTQLAELGRLVEQLVKKAPPEVQERAAKNLDLLTKEATSKNPDRAWYDVSATGLMEAAKSVAELALPITTAVKAVLALLA